MQWGDASADVSADASAANPGLPYAIALDRPGAGYDGGQGAWVDGGRADDSLLQQLFPRPSSTLPECLQRIGAGLDWRRAGKLSARRRKQHGRRSLPPSRSRRPPIAPPSPPIAPTKPLQALRALPSSPSSSSRPPSSPAAPAAPAAAAQLCISSISTQAPFHSLHSPPRTVDP
ncbi:hypothetical protein AOQ84DRAFT_225041 [Glonium stellatum]|uniref:Uncharacterized protein n=1 Tax=Glonium stellatum TaxID=574774 RepID=A0A8E2JQ36_9PEZI|nr:hypothetical protein AOQ84DRAFT_225041 [Glonium stellatum]